MAQRLWTELDYLNHDVHVVIPTSSKQLIEETNNYKPDLIIAPFLTSKIPPEIWKNYTCFIVHPGIIGDRGASSLDWAILQNKKKWGVTIIEAVEKMDAGPIWASNNFKMRKVSKSEIYRNEVTQAASKGILQAISKFGSGFVPIPLDYANPQVKGVWNAKTSQSDYQFSWTDNTLEIINKINAADSSPGVLISLYENNFYCYGAHLESSLTGKPGSIIAQRDKAICIATKDKAIWITHLKSSKSGQIKLPATIALEKLIAASIPVSEINPFKIDNKETWSEISFEQDNHIGYLNFNFYNGAMDTDQCHRLRKAIIEAKKKVKLLVLLGGRDVWSNGIHLNVIENAESPPEESWKNINAINDLILELINSTDHYIIAALQGNAGAGGVSLALAADKIICRNGIVLNPHTKNVGLYGSEYWTYLLPKRIGHEKATRFTEDCLPWGVKVAYEIGLIDDFHGETNVEFLKYVKQQANKVINLSYFDKLIKAKKFQRKKDERNKTLESYRSEELKKMYKNFFENDLDYSYKRFCFVHKITNKNSEAIKNLYRNRREIYRKRKWENLDYNT